MAEFRLPEKRATIELDAVGLPGGEIDVSIRMPLALMEQAASFQNAGNLEGLRGLFLEWADASWNLADHRGSIPVTAEGFGRLEPTEQIAVITAWLRGVVQLPAPLSPPFGDTGKSGKRRGKTRP